MPNHKPEGACEAKRPSVTPNTHPERRTGIAVCATITVAFASLSLGHPALASNPPDMPTSATPDRSATVNDAGIQSRVRMQLARTPGLSENTIQIHVRRGRVRLRGRVRSISERQAAASAAASIPGVVSVDGSDLRIGHW